MWANWLDTYEPPLCGEANCKIKNSLADKVIIREGEGKEVLQYLDRREQSSRRENARLSDGKTSKEQLLQIAKLQQFKCYFCLTELTKHPEWIDPCSRGDIANWDHLIPVTRGGSNNPENMALTCKSCNQEKSNRTEKEYWKYRESLGRSDLNKKAQAFIKTYRREKSKV